jgi:hypothetical protein
MPATAFAHPIHASCHCGAVRIEVARTPRKLTQCNCSICRRYGVLWAYYTRKSVKIIARVNARSAYSRRENGLEFYHCRTCGCLTHYESPKKGTDGRVAVNARMMDQLAVARIPIKMLDGDATWRTLDEYVQPELFISPTKLRGAVSART